MLNRDGEQASAYIYLRMTPGCAQRRAAC